MFRRRARDPQEHPLRIEAPPYELNRIYPNTNQAPLRAWLRDVEAKHHDDYEEDP